MKLSMVGVTQEDFQAVCSIESGDFRAGFQVVFRGNIFLESGPGLPYMAMHNLVPPPPNLLNQETVTCSVYVQVSNHC